MQTMLRYFTIIIAVVKLNAQWELRYPDIPSDQINDIVFLDDSTGFIVNNGGSVLMTSDGGTTWKVKAHYQRNIFSEIKFIDDQNGFAFSPYSHLYDNVSFIFTTDGGLHWEQGSSYLGDAITFLPLSASVVLKSTKYNGMIYRLDNFFGNWRATYQMNYFFDIDVGVPYGDILQLYRQSSGRVLALGSSWRAKQYNIISDSVAFILKSDDNGDTWDTLWCGLTYSPEAFFFYNDTVGWLGAEKNRIYKTIDGGLSWTLQYADSVQDYGIQSLSSPDGVNVFAADGSGRIIKSTNGGEDWNYIQVGQPNGLPFKLALLNASEGYLAGNDFFSTKDGGTTWQRVSKSLKGNLVKIDFANKQIGIGVGGENIYGGQNIYKTSDGGRNWNIVYSSPFQIFSYVDMLDSLNLWVTSHDSVYKSTDGGESWLSFKLGSDVYFARGVQFLNSNVGVIFEVWEYSSDTTFNYVTTDGGLTWNKYTINNLPFVSSFFKIKFTDPNHLWFSNQYGVWLSNDTAKTWKLFPVDRAFWSFDFIDSTHGWLSLWGGHHNEMVYTTNSGATWSYVDKPHSEQTQDIIMYKSYGITNVIAAGYEGSLIRFIEGDDFVHNIPTYTSNPINSFASYYDGGMLHLWAAGNGMTVLHYSSIVTEVGEKLEQAIITFNLKQNYPNPFNPTTTLEYQLPKRAHVTIKIFDVIGREVAVLVNEQKDAGTFKAMWNASRFSSGMYFAKMTAGNYSETKKLLLLK